MSEEKKEAKRELWEIIERHEGGDTARLLTAKGWIYRSREVGYNGETSVALVFVPYWS